MEVAERRDRGIVLSGGGARGAYEAGVLLTVLQHLHTRPGAAPDYICGTSVGAATGAWLAGALAEPQAAGRALEEGWVHLKLADVLRFGLTEAGQIPRLLSGGDRPAGVFDGRRLAAAVGGRIEWPQVRRQLESGRLQALTVTATQVTTGRPVVFFQRRPEVPAPTGSGRNVVVREARIGLPHVLASASILFGKVLNAFLLDHVLGDLDELERINRFLADGEAVFGPDFGQQMRAQAERRGQPAYEPVQAAVVRPSEDLAAVAADHLRQIELRCNRDAGAQALLKLLDAGSGARSDLASYLLFDGAYAREILELGRRDAASALDSIEAVLAPQADL